MRFPSNSKLDHTANCFPGFFNSKMQFVAPAAYNQEPQVLVSLVWALPLKMLPCVKLFPKLFK